MSLLNATRGRMVLTGMLVTGLGAGVTVGLAAQDTPPPQQPPGDPAPGQDPGEQTHSGIVVDLASYVQKQEEQREPARPTQPGHEPGGDPGGPESSAQPMGDPPPDEGGNDGIDWAVGDYRDNLENGVPAVIIVEEETPWGESEEHAYVVAFDPDDRNSEAAHEALADSAGEEVEVVGDAKKEGARRGLRVLMIEDVR